MGAKPLKSKVLIRTSAFTFTNIIRGKIVRGNGEAF